MRFPWLLVLAALLTASSPAAAQITLTPVRDLAFGPVIVGVPTHIGPSHPVRSGQFQFTAPLLSRVQLRFTLPNQLDGPAGATLPIGFANNDALHVGTAPASVPMTFNPKATRTFVVTDATILVFIGGTVSPAGTQAPGTYAGTITLTVTIL
jgi:hypothetical protein